MNVKQLIFFSGILSFLVMSCANNSDSPKAGSENEKPATVDLSSNPDYQKGLALIGKNDCTTCHDIRNNTTGPAYLNVAKKYEPTPENIAMLASKIQKGDSGTWGNVPMTPHPNLSTEDAEQLVKYILLLKHEE